MLVPAQVFFLLKKKIPQKTGLAPPYLHPCSNAIRVVISALYPFSWVTLKLMAVTKMFTLDDIHAMLISIAIGMNGIKLGVVPSYSNG